MDKVVSVVLESFEKNRELAEDAVRAIKSELVGHQHGISCFSWRRCRKMEKIVAETEARIKNYNEAEKGLEEGNYTKAIEVLGRISDQLKETSWQTVMRIANSPAPATVEDILNTPISIVYRAKQYREHLVKLQETGKQLVS